MSIKVLALDCTAETDAEPSAVGNLLHLALNEHAALGVEGERVFLATANLGSSHGTGSGWPTIRTKILGAQILLVATPAVGGEPNALDDLLTERLADFAEGRDEHGHLQSYGKVAATIAVGENASAVSAGLVKALVDAGFTIAANSAVSQASESDITTMARNTAHLAGLLRATSYPKKD